MVALGCSRVVVRLGFASPVVHKRLLVSSICKGKMMSRKAWIALAGTGAGGAVGLGIWTYFLAGKSLDVMDQMSSVLSSFGALVSIVLAVVGLILALRSTSTTESGSNRVFRAKNASGARVTLGDHSPISENGRR